MFYRNSKDDETANTNKDNPKITTISKISFKGFRMGIIVTLVTSRLWGYFVAVLMIQYSTASLTNDEMSAIKNDLERGM